MLYPSENEQMFADTKVSLLPPTQKHRFKIVALCFKMSKHYLVYIFKIIVSHFLYCKYDKKCGCLEERKWTFAQILSWSIIYCSFALHGLGVSFGKGCVLGKAS